jgi:TetR/AcrR family transcriptional regulator
MKRKGQVKKTRMSGEDRRRSIIDAALQLFAEKGFNGTRTKEIAQKAGISETLIFQHFKTKEALYSTAFKQLITHHPPVQAIERSATAKDDAGILREIALHAVEHCRSDPHLLRMSLYGALEGISMRRDAEENTTLSDFLAGYIEQRIKDGAFHRVNARLAARLFFDSILMYMLDQKVTFTGPALPYSGEEAVDTLVDIFLYGLRRSRR